ncbi:MFS general substrate transporter [Acephala macrosclerotiorum]|nr:MFS general substrate transporter [Acephala macrosclerotiorum]
MKASGTQQRRKSFWDELPFPFGQRSWWVDGTTHLLDLIEEDPELWRVTIIDEFDHHGFDGQVFGVAALGFLTDSYALFATNIVLPSLAYIYWPLEFSGTNEFAINFVTILGSLLGQLLFGFLADKLGRRKLYGLELVTVIFGTLGLAQASTGVHNNMNILGWIIFWRFVLGIGIGAEYPLSAVITAEFADRKARAKMMAAMFMMQPLGQIFAAAVGWGVLTSIVRSRGLDNLSPADLDLRKDEIRSTIDATWRIVVAVGAFPALLATLWRFSIPESPRYTMDVDRDVKRALADVRRHYDPNYKPTKSIPAGMPSGHSANTNGTGASSGLAIPIQLPARRGTANNTPNVVPTAQNASQSGTPERSFYSYLFVEGNIRYLFATAFCWFLLDFAFFGLGINSPRQLGQVWAGSYPTNTTVPYWEDPFDTNSTLYWQLFDSVKEYTYTICFGSFAGSITLLCIIDYIPRKGFLVGSFLALSALFVITAILIATVEFRRGHWATVVFYAFCQFLFNLGPNTLTFIIPAEIFPTEFRCRCHGLSAAAGKFGAVIVQIIMWRMHSQHLSIVIGVFSIPMALGALFAWVWLPELQTGPDPNSSPKALRFPKLPNKGLETLARGYHYANGTDTRIDPATGEPRGEAQGLGFTRKVPHLLRWIWSKLFNGGFHTQNNGRDSDDEGTSLHRVTVTSDERAHATNAQNVTAPQPAYNPDEEGLRQPGSQPRIWSEFSGPDRISS